MTHAANDIAPTVPAGAVFKKDVSEKPGHTNETHLAARYKPEGRLADTYPCSRGWTGSKGLGCTCPNH
jgi:hypothetical protein